jgi:predicted secreted protein
MTLVSTALIYVVIWWLVFFMALPIGARSYHEAGEEVEAGNVSSAPMRPRLWLKAGVTTGIAAVLTLIAYFLIDSGALSIRP